MKKPFDKIKLAQLLTLCNTLADTQVRHVSNIKRKYLENGLSFDETLSFLQELQIIKNNFGELSPSKSFSIAHDSIGDFRQKLLPILFSTTGVVSEQLQNFLSNFEIADNKIFFKATEIEKIKFSGTRNLLLEMEFIIASVDNTTYFINPEYFELFLNKFKRIKLSPESFKRRQTENDLIGLSAEKAVIEFEKNRLTKISTDSNEIEHVSLKDVMAGYDIKSFENYLDLNSNRICRYIEVKAVSVQDFKFYWSRNEIQTAKIFGNKYFLYLLPVNTSNTFDFEKLIIIENPFKNIYSNISDWKKEEENISFSKNIGG